MRRFHRTSWRARHLFMSRYRTPQLPTELDGWLGRVVIPYYHILLASIIATPAPVWYHKKAMDP